MKQLNLGLFCVMFFILLLGVGNAAEENIHDYIIENYENDYLFHFIARHEGSNAIPTPLELDATEELIKLSPDDTQGAIATISSGVLSEARVIYLWQKRLSDEEAYLEYLKNPVTVPVCALIPNKYDTINFADNYDDIVVEVIYELGSALEDDLIIGLDDSSISVRIFAQNVVGLIPEKLPNAVNHMIDYPELSDSRSALKLFNDYYFYTRPDLVLRNLPGELTVDYCTKVLMDDGYPAHTRIRAGWLIISNPIEAEEYYEDILSLYHVEADTDVRIALLYCITALDIAGDDAIPILLDVLGDEEQKDESIIAAFDLLRTYGDLTEDVTPSLIDMLKYAERPNKYLNEIVFYEDLDSREIELVKKAVLAAHEYDMSYIRTVLLKGIYGREWVADVYSAILLNYPIARVREDYALRIGGRECNPIIVAALKEAIGDEDVNVRYAALITLIRVGELVWVDREEEQTDTNETDDSE